MACYLLLAVSFTLGLAQNGLAGPGFSGVWHYVDVRSILCQGGPGFVDLTIQKPATGDYEPHVFTVFRTSNSGMTISFVARDASGRTIADQSSGINLQPVSPGNVMNYGRRLGNESLIEGEAPNPSGPSGPSDSPSPRRLSSRRRSFSDSRRRSYTDSRRRTVSSPRRRVVSSPRRRMLDDRRRTSTVDTSRRRATSDVTSSDRRRSYTDDSYTSRRRSTTSSDRRRRSFSSYSNPSRPNMGQYGYSNPSYASQNYGGHMPMTTPYGYSGANAYQGSSGSGMKIAIAGGAGLLAGIAANKLMHHWGGYSHEQLMNAPCSTGSWQGTCGSCVNQYGANNCNAMLSPKFNAARDDLMSTGFTPAQVTWPLQVRVTHIAGPDFNPMVICTPPSPGLAPPPVPQVFLTLTALTHPNSGGSAYGGYSQYGGYSPGYEQQTARGGIIATIMSSLLSCCCLCGLAAFCCLKGKKPTGDSSSDDDYEGTQLSHHGYNPYWDTGSGAHGSAHGPVHGNVHGFARGFMGTAAPNGKYWSEYCHGEPEISSANFIVGPWGECLAWAVVYEHQNNWESDPDYQELGPVGGVIRAMMERAADDKAQAVQCAAEELEVYCKEAINQDKPLPVINQRA